MVSDRVTDLLRDFKHMWDGIGFYYSLPRDPLLSRNDFKPLDFNLSIFFRCVYPYGLLVLHDLIPEDLLDITEAVEGGQAGVGT